MSVYLFTYLLAHYLLLAYHGISWTLRQLKYFINKKLGLRRRHVQSPIADVRRAIALELRGSGRLLGYRSMTRRLQRKHDLSVGRHVVREALKIMDPSGVSQRRQRRLEQRTYRSPGPNAA